MAMVGVQSSSMDARSVAQAHPEEVEGVPATSGLDILALRTGLWGLCADYHIESKELGRGANAAVYAVVSKDEEDSTNCSLEGGAVVKFFDPATPDNVDKHLATIMQEVAMLAAVQKHPNIVGFHGLFHNDGTEMAWPNSATYAMMMDRCSGGDLSSLMMKSKRPLSEGQASGLYGGLLAALAHVHSRGVLHRDVKTENIILTSKAQPVLADFGLACHKTDREEMKRRCGSAGYAAPELVVGSEYDEKVDIFGAGVVLYFLVQAKLPFHGPDVMSMFRRTIRCNVKFDHAKAGAGPSDSCKSCILSLLQKSALDRPDATTATMHPWLQHTSPEGGSLRAFLPRSDLSISTMASSGMGEFLSERDRQTTARTSVPEDRVPSFQEEVPFPVADEEIAFAGEYVPCKPSKKQGQNFRRRYDFCTGPPAPLDDIAPVLDLAMQGDRDSTQGTNYESCCSGSTTPRDSYRARWSSSRGENSTHPPFPAACASNPSGFSSENDVMIELQSASSSTAPASPLNKRLRRSLRIRQAQDFAQQQEQDMSGIAQEEDPEASVNSKPEFPFSRLVSADPDPIEVSLLPVVPVDPNLIEEHPVVAPSSTRSSSKKAFCRRLFWRSTGHAEVTNAEASADDTEAEDGPRATNQSATSRQGLIGSLFQRSSSRGLR